MVRQSLVLPELPGTLLWKGASIVRRQSEHSQGMGDQNWQSSFQLHASTAFGNCVEKSKIFVVAAVILSALYSCHQIRVSRNNKVGIPPPLSPPVSSLYPFIETKRSPCHAT
eukprot:scaffold258987_cov21-Tisochrysis_lutea.AAC.1